MSGTVTETDSDRPESESPTMSANEPKHIGSLPRVQLNHERQGSDAGAGSGVRDSSMITDQGGRGEVPHGATGALPRKQSGTSVSNLKKSLLELGYRLTILKIFQKIGVKLYKHLMIQTAS